MHRMLKWIVLIILLVSNPASAQFNPAGFGNPGFGASQFSSNSPFANACGSVPAGQNWCVGTDGWTVVTPTLGTTGVCGATGSSNGTCGTYLSDQGTGTSATCRVALDPASFDITATFPDSLACPMTSATVALARDGSSDFLLLKRTACFYEPSVTTNACTGSANTTTTYGIIPSASVIGHWSATGKSTAAPIVVAAYGPISGARPKVITTNNCFNTQSVTTAGSNVMLLSIDCDFQFRNPASALYPAINIGVSGAAGQKTVVLANPVPAYVKTAITNWRIINYSNNTQFSTLNGASAPIASVDATGTILTLNANLPTGWDVQAGDQIQLVVASDGIFMNTNNISWFYIEDMKISYGGLGIQPTPTGSLNANYFIRRNTIEYCYAQMIRAQCIFLSDTFSATTTILVEENIVDHAGNLYVNNDCTPLPIMPVSCGGLPSLMVPGANGAPPDQSQNAYTHENFGNATYKRNILARASGSAAQLRSGGLYYNNLAIGNSTGSSSGGILNPNFANYNVTTSAVNSVYATAQTSAATASGSTLTFTLAPLWLTPGDFAAIYDVNTGTTLGNRKITGVTPTTITIGGSAFSVGANDIIVFSTLTTSQNYGASSSSTVSGGGQPSNVQWNIVANSASSALDGQLGGYGFLWFPSAVRAPGNVMSNNYMVNTLNIGIQDQTVITSVDGNAACGGQIRVGLTNTTSWTVGDPIVTSGIAGIAGTVNGSFTVASIPSLGFLCLSGSSYSSGTWTANTGLINGGIAFSNNFYSNVGTPILPSTSPGTPTSFTPSGTGPGCPQALNCPSIEAYDLFAGGDGTITHFITQAKTNRKGNWNPTWTANPANNYIRSKTSPAIQLQFLLKRDLNPTSNDNDPMWLEKAA